MRVNVAWAGGKALETGPHFADVIGGVSWISVNVNGYDVEVPRAWCREEAIPIGPGWEELSSAEQDEVLHHLGWGSVEPKWNVFRKVLSRHYRPASEFTEHQLAECDAAYNDEERYPTDLNKDRRAFAAKVQELEWR
jgi:hypothetical protein